MNLDRLNELLSRFRRIRIAVLGDFCLDKYLDFDPSLGEISLETGKTAHQVIRVRHTPGAAGTVTCNLAALGAGALIPMGFMGDDGEGYELRQDLVKLGCTMDYLQQVSERLTPTYLKPRSIAVSTLEGEYERFDTKNYQHLPVYVEKAIRASLDVVLPGVDALIVMDQVEEDGYGAVTSGIREYLADLADRHPNVVFWADSRSMISSYRNVIIKVNQFEAVKAVFPDRQQDVNDDSVLASGHILAERTGKPVFITRSERGVLVFDGIGCQEVSGVRIDGPIDPTGAGDSATAGAVLTLASGGSLVEAALVANLVASITVQQIGVTGTASPEMLVSRLWHHGNTNNAGDNGNGQNYGLSGWREHTHR